METLFAPLPLEKRQAALVALGAYMARFLASPASDDMLEHCFHRNNWFTIANLRYALTQWAAALTPQNVAEWIARYSFPAQEGGKRIGIVGAGNIPLAPLHDVLTVLLCGHIAHLKPASQDAGLAALVQGWLHKVAPEVASRFHIVERLVGHEAVIATGSNNSARYFEYYFGNVPHIIRKNRTSVAVLSGFEDEADYAALANDAFRYFGLGCRSITKLYVPQDAEFEQMFLAFEPWRHLADHHKFFHNYEYQLAGALVGNEPVLTNDFMVLRESPVLNAGVAVLNYARYHHLDEVKQDLEANADALQCVVSKDGFLAGSLPFGQAQQPALWDYADKVDTVAFCLSL